MAKKENIENEKLCAILSYILIGVIWYFADEKMKKSEFARYHAKQGLALFLTNIIFWIAASVPVIGWIIRPVLYLAILILLIIGIINAANNSMKPLPLIGKMAEKLSF